MTQARSPDYVLRKVWDMQNRLKVGDTVNFASDFSEFKREYPAVHQKAKNLMTENDFQMLVMMLKKIRDINHNVISQHQGSIDVGQELVDTFVKPALENSNRETS